MIKSFKSIRSLGKAKKTLKRTASLYLQKQKKLDPNARERIESLLTDLQTAIIQKHAEKANLFAQQVETEAAHLMPKSTKDKVFGFVGGTLGALLIAVLIRQMWFEFYSIPTGSMRPTLKEGDYLVVSKTDYGINTPLRSGHFLFDPTLVERGSIVVWTGENMDMPDDSTMYFYVIPGKKQYIKRLIGKPGDTLYFYGGKIYGIDRKGTDLAQFRNASYFQSLEHIPFIRPEGKVELSSQSSAIFYQMGQPMAKLTANAFGTVAGELIGQKGHEKPASYSDFWGFQNYAMARLLTKDQVDELHPKMGIHLDNAPLYLELQHHPSIQGAKLIRDDLGRVRPGLASSVSLLPLQQEHIAKIASHMTTSRFKVKKGRIYRYGSGSDNESIRPKLAGVPDGTYEIQNGHAVEVLFGGVTRALAPDHPLLKQDPSHIQALYNFGFEVYAYESSINAQIPSRYAYFRDGDLFLMGGAVMQKEDPALQNFLRREKEKEAISTSIRPYTPFQDRGAPFTEDGQIDVAFIKKYGVTVPEKMYLVMGDNHAMSADSRLFGFVPQDNLRGGASFLFWPAGDRFGRHPQAAIRHLTAPNLIVITIAALSCLLSICYTRKKYFSAPLFRKSAK